jgi:hypothetical protein
MYVFTIDAENRVTAHAGTNQFTLQRANIVSPIRRS